AAGERRGSYETEFEQLLGLKVLHVDRVSRVLPINGPPFRLGFEQVDVVVEAGGNEPLEEGLAVGAHFSNEARELCLSGGIGVSHLVWPGRDIPALHTP